MLCPEVWNFPSPPFTSKTIVCNKKTDILKVIENQNLTHHISITLPNIMKVPQNLINMILEDSQFYRVNKVHVSEFFTKEFNELFVKNGRLTAISIESIRDQDDSFMMTPNETAVLMLSKKTYQELENLQGDIVTVYQRSQSMCFCIDVSAKTNHSEKSLKQIYEKLKSCSNLCFDVVLAWEPHAGNICPSSIGYYFSLNNLKVKTCDVRHKQRHEYNLVIPRLQDNSDVAELVEWLGAFNLECDLPDDSYLSSMKYSENCQVFGQVMHLSFTGLFDASKVNKIISEVMNLVTHSSTWINVELLSFKGCHIKYETKNSFQATSDHVYSIIFCPSGSSFVYFYQDYKLAFN